MVNNVKFQPKGIIPAMITPMNKNGDVDEKGIVTVLDHLLAGGVHGIFVSGSQGEFWALTESEKKLLFEKTVEIVNGKVPVYAGTGAISTNEVISLTRMAMDIGVDAASIITPYFIKPNENELFNHYREVANRVDMPLLVYSNPGRTNVPISPSMMERLHRECSNIVGIKDSSGDLTITGEYIDRCGKDFSVLAGRDTLILATLLYGGQGGIAACGNVVPRLVVKIYESYISGDLEGALDAQRRLAPLRHAFSLGTFPVVIKEAMNLMGFSVGECRNPVTKQSISSGNLEILKTTLKNLGVELQN